jgi:hypothetical protein
LVHFFISNTGKHVIISRIRDTCWAQMLEEITRAHIMRFWYDSSPFCHCEWFSLMLYNSGQETITGGGVYSTTNTQCPQLAC